MLWTTVLNRVRSMPPRESIVMPATLLPHPRDVGFIRTLGAPQGQWADWALSQKDGTRIHTVEIMDADGGYYNVHWDEVDPAVDPAGHLAVDAPAWGFALGMVALLGLVALIIFLARR